MLTEAEFAEATEFPIHSERVRRLIAHDRAQRAEIERLKGELETTLTALTGFIDSQAAERDRAEKAEATADRYLAAIREWEGADDAHAKKAFARSYRADTRSRLEAAESALRAIAEGARRG